jgi:hypothetical protein
MAQLLRDSQEAYQLLTMSDDERHYRNMREQDERHQRLKAKRAAQQEQQQPEVELPKKKKGHAADDELDLIMAERTLNQTLEGRSLHADLAGAPIRRLDEPYPNEDMSCSKNGKLEAQTQEYFMCRSDFFENGEAFRVTKDDYEALANYPDDFECYSEVRDTFVCMCNPYAKDVLCMTELDQSCFVNITNPPLYKGCNGTDSDYYMYSLGGYAPCYFYDFTQAYTFDMKIECMLLYNTTNKTDPDPPTDRLLAGYQYRDVVQKPNNYKDTPIEPLTNELTINFTVRDMKYLSNANRTKLVTSDPFVMTGQKDVSMRLDFNDLLE